jgi:fumarate hydratase class II
LKPVFYQKKRADLIGQVCDEILEGKLDAAFPLVVWQTGSGTQSNMNVNEVVAYRAHVLNGGNLPTKKKYCTPTMTSTNHNLRTTPFPLPCTLRPIKYWWNTTIPALKGCATPGRKKQAFMNVVKIGRTHFMDATPLTLGQEFSGYVSQLDHGLKAIRNTLTTFVRTGPWRHGCWHRH